MKFKALAILLFLVVVQFPLTSSAQVCSEFAATEATFVYAAAPHALVNGFVGTPLGDHGGTTHPYTELTGSALRFRGGTGNFSDRIEVDIPVPVHGPNWILTSHFRHDYTCSARPAFHVKSDGTMQAYLLQTSADLNGVSVPWSTAANTWYTMEIINDDANGIAEMRIWPDTGSRPGSPLVTAAPATIGTVARLVGNNYCAPEVLVDCVHLQEFSPVATEKTTWSTVKASYR